MKKLTKILALTLAVVTLCATFVACGNKATLKDGVITVGTNAEFPPFEYVSNGNGLIGNYDGIDIAIFQQIGKDNDMKVNIENMEFDSLIVALKNGQIDATISGMTITDERKEEVDFSTPYYTATQVLIVKEGSDIKSAADLAGKKIAVIQGYTGETCISKLGYKPNEDYVAFNKGTEAILELVNGKCDVVVLDSATAVQYVADNPGLTIVEDNTTFEVEEYGVAVKKGNTELLNMINKTIEKMKEDGSLDALITKYSEGN